MVIGFAGRLRSGKTEAANILVDGGFEKMSFAYPLKKFVSEFLMISMEELNDRKNGVIGDTDYVWTYDKQFERMQNMTGVPAYFFKEKLNCKVIHGVRKILQVMGTDVLRAYDNDWHVKEVRKLIDPKKNYVFDDVRFPNEVSMIREFGGKVWFVVRNKTDNIINHSSEVSLRWQHFEPDIILNTGTLEEFRHNVKCVTSKDIDSTAYEKWVADVIADYRRMRVGLDYSKILSASPSGDKAIKVEYENGTVLYDVNPLLLEDLKAFIE